MVRTGAARPGGWRRLVAALAVVGGVFGAADGTSRPAGADATSSLPSVTSGRRPGPDILYAPPPPAPILQNHDPRFRAAPLLVSGEEAYLDGEYVYQDHLYDDYGADTNFFGNTPLQARYGDIDPPTDRARYGGNGADLVELRIVPLATEVVYRFTFNTLLVADAPIVAIAFDTDGSPATGRSTLPRDPGAPFPGTDQVLTAWGTGAEHSLLPTTGAAVTTPVPVVADVAANQVTVTVPRSVSDPSGTWRMTWATGLYDGTPGGTGWLKPGNSATATQPGGANNQSGVSGILNVGPRLDEAYLSTDTPPDTDQAAALRAKTPTTFQHPLSWTELAARTSRSTVPTSGTTVRIFPSRLGLGEGRNLGGAVSAGGPPQYLGQLQPYSLYVPTAAAVADPPPLPFTLSLHSLGEQHWQYNGAKGILQIGEDLDTFVATPMGRGSGMWYQQEGEADVFEVWADVAHHFRLDPNRAAISGYSMGGYGTYRLGGLYPDLFGKAYTTVGPPADGIWIPPMPATGGEETNSNHWLENTRNLPFLNLVAAQDELVPIRGPVAQNAGDQATGVVGFEQLGYRYRFRIYDPAEHMTIGALSYDVKAAPEFLADTSIDRDPAHITFSHLPASDHAALGLLHDHAYWVSDVVADGPPTSATTKGTVDVFTHALGVGDPVSSALTPSAGVDPIAFTEVGRDWGPPPTIPAANKLDVRLTGVTSATLDLARAAISLAAPITAAVDSDRQATLLLAGEFVAPTVTGAASWQITPAGLQIVVPSGHSDIVVSEATTDPTIAEAPVGLLLPLGAIAVGVAVILRRRRQA